MELRARGQQWQENRIHSERAYFRRCIKAARTHDPKSSLDAVMQWLHQIHEGKESPRLEIFAEKYGDHRDKQVANELVLAASSDDHPGWNGQSLVRSLKRARARRVSLKRRNEITQTVLPALNPRKPEAGGGSGCGLRAKSTSDL